jgi:hypothetical protein
MPVVLEASLRHPFRAPSGYRSQNTTSTSYTNLSTSGPAVSATVSSSGEALVTLTANMFNSSVLGSQTCFMAFAVSGATTILPNDTQALAVTSAAAADGAQVSATFLETGLTAGSNTFIAEYRTSASICTFLNRNIIVTPY